MAYRRRLRFDGAKIMGLVSGMCVGFGAYQADALGSLSFDIPERPSHYEMNARVVSVTKICRLQFNAGQSRLTRAMHCRDARKAVKRPLFADYEVIERDRVEYRYYGPRGGELTGQFEVGHIADVPAFGVNDLFPVQVNIENPEDVARL